VAAGEAETRRGRGRGAEEVAGARCADEEVTREGADSRARSRGDEDEESGVGAWGATRVGVGGVGWGGGALACVLCCGLCF
jgi:hypothetical protein